MRQRISKGLEDAEAAARDRDLARAEREAALDEARKEAQAMIARATKIADDSKAEILAEAKAQAEKATSKARDEITAEKDRAMAELRTHVAELALEAAGRLVKLGDGRPHPAQAGGGLPVRGDAGRRQGEPQLAWRAARPQLAATRRPPSRSAVPTARSTTGSATWRP